ncbi:hypothetical protein FQN54_007534 [Arachnomyces sp. PD_36]|nr:hypothetical protein FQN54_007534 [Arachnomyces sp. PD_36]
MSTRNNRGGRGARGAPAATGRGQRGGGGQNQEICNTFALRGRCRYGAGCRFSHASELREEQPYVEPANEKSELEDDYRLWKRQLRWAPPSNDSDAGKRMWSKALELVEKGAKEYQQRLLRDLLSDEHSGLEHVRQILDMRPNESGSAFIQYVRPFITLVAHPGFLDCLSLDTYVGDLYVFMSGSGGSRAIPFFQALIQSIIEEGPSTEQVGNIVPVMLLALREIFRRNQKALYHDDIPEVMEKLKQLSLMVSPAASHIVTSRISEIERMVARANGTLVTQNEEGTQSQYRQPNPRAPSTYPKEIRIPGDRHDNDKKNIAEIKIIPTGGEILADEPDFLPSLNKDQPHFLEGIERMLDTHFRLLRNDIFGDVKLALGDLLSAERQQYDKDNIQVLETSMANAGAHFYSSASVVKIGLTRKRGFEATIIFAQPHQVYSRPPVVRRQWWEDTRRLEEGSLLCFISLRDVFRPLVFLTVSERNVDQKVHHSLTSDPRHAGITVKLADGEDQDQVELLAKFYMQFKSPEGCLIEFPRVLLGTFLPVLENLQRMHRDSRLPFANWILPNWKGEPKGEELHIPPPIYARSPTFSFDLKPILVGRSKNLTFKPSSEQDDMLDKLQESTLLDEGQCKALINALSSEFSLIQGPPGTGKSYLGVQLLRVLVANSDKAQLGPIVVVCYTNHALDQFLEHLIEVGIDKIIRIGGRSTSKALEGKNIRDISVNETKTRNEKQIIGSNFAEIELLEKEVQRTLKQASHTRTVKWNNIENHLRVHFPEVHRQFSLVGKDGFKQVSKLDLLDRWKAGVGEDLRKLGGPLPTLASIITASKQSIFRLALPDRRLLLEHMVEKVRNSLAEKISGVVQEDTERRARINTVYDEVDRRLLETADVIGVTTTGLAKRIAVLQHVNAKVVICEEAGEVLEAHMLSTLIPSVEHLIQIGDHQQLRPQISNFQLSMESKEGKMYQLDRSQFERLAMVNQGEAPFPVAQLNVQRRMRPEISNLIRSTVYPELKDHDTVERLPDVVGMRDNIFWYDHTNHEDGGNPAVKQRSQSNTWEVEMVHALVKHIVRQGAYNSRDIAVLTPYVGQLQKLRAVMRQDFEIVLSEKDEDILVKDGYIEDLAINSEQKISKKFLEKKKMSDMLRIATVDNFQGEEAKVIVVSLVRSNKEDKVGFLRTTNRINVLLSRAQHGMFIFGNSKAYSKIPMWSQVIDILRANNSIGKALALCCPRHPETEILVTRPEDFAFLSPEGGCRKPCNRRLENCSHRCLAKCHSDVMHQTFRCPKPCERLFKPCGHECFKDCSDPCGLCEAIVDNVPLPCGHHVDRIACHISQKPSSIKCDIEVQKRVPGCDHILTVPCNQDNVAIYAKGLVVLAISQLGMVILMQSSIVNAQRYVVGDLEPASIHVRSLATVIKTVVFVPNVARYVVHTLPAADYAMKGVSPVLRDALGLVSTKDNARCHAQHHVTVCPAPSAAKSSSPVAIDVPKQDQRVDMLELKTYGEININETPIVVLACGHFFTAETLDGHVGMSDVYEQNNDGEFTGLRKVSGMGNQSVPRCPDCQSPIQQYATQRYNRVINRAVMDEASKKFLVSGQVKLQVLENEIDLFEQEVEGSVRMNNAPGFRQVQSLSSTISNQSSRMEKEAMRFIHTVDDKNHPVRKLHDATVKANRAKRSLEDRMQQLTTEPLDETLCCDRLVIVGGQMARVRVHQIYLQAILGIARGLDVKKNDSEAREVLDACKYTVKRASIFFKKCEQIVQVCSQDRFPKNSVEARLYYGRVVASFQSNKYAFSILRANQIDHFERAKEHLKEAETLCELPFKNADSLKIAVQETLKILDRDRYEAVTAAELQAIKDAMVSGQDGMATHSGHWYNCENGHPFAVGECGMPMQEARCPECGSAVGGQNHAPAQGVTRATQMEG